MLRDYPLSVTETAGLLGISRQAVFKLIKNQRLDFIVEKGDFGTIQYKLSAASVSAWADRKDRELDHKLLSATEGAIPSTKQPTNQPTQQPTNQATKEPTFPGKVNPLFHIRAEAGRWKGKYEAAAESLAREREDRRTAEERVGQLAYELGGAKREVKLLEEKLALLTGPRSAAGEGKRSTHHAQPPSPNDGFPQ